MPGSPPHSGELVPLADVPPHPYLRRHLIGHAGLGRALNDHTVPARLLPWETSGTVRGYLGLPLALATTRTTLGAWATIEPLAGDAPPMSRALSLQFARTALHTAPDPGDPRPGPSQPTPAGLLRTLWARWPLTADR